MQKIHLLIACFLLGWTMLAAQNRDVIICLDESGSMYGDKFENLVYAIQLTASLLDENDRLFVIRGGGIEVIEIDLKNKKSAINTKIKKGINFPNGNAECHVLEPAYKLMKKDSHREKTVIIYGDGAWQNCGIEAKIVSDFKTIKPKIIFFKIENGAAVRQRSFLENHLSGLPKSGFKVLENPAGNIAKLKENLFKLSKTVIDADPTKTKINISGKKVEFIPKFPLKKVLVVIQKRGCKLTNTSLDIKENISISNKNTGGNLRGEYYEIAADDKAILPKGNKITFELDCNISEKDIEIIPIVAMDLIVEVEGDFIEKDIKKMEYSLCEREKEVKVKLYLTDDKGKKIKLSSFKGIQLEVSNGTTTKKLTIKGDEATGIIGLPDEITYLTLEAQYEGYFQKKSKIISIKKEVCPLTLDIEIDGAIKTEDSVNKTITVCDDVKNLEVSTWIKDDTGMQKAFADLGKITIEIVTQDGVFPLTNKENNAIGQLPLTSEITKATFQLSIDGKVVYKSKNYTIIKEACGAKIDTSTIDMGEETIMDFVEEGLCTGEIKVIFENTGETISPKDYTISITGVPYELEAIIDTTGDFFNICFRKRPYLCDCFIRHGTFGGTLTISPKDKEMRIIKKQWEFEIITKSNFFLRCKKCLILALVLGFLLWYLYGIWTKPRFHRTARFFFTEEDRNRRYGSNPEDEYWLRTSSFVSRYLVPYIPEKKIIGDEALLMIASTRKGVVYLSRKSFSPKMRVNGAKIDEEDEKNESIYENDTIRIGKSTSRSVKYTFQVN